MTLALRFALALSAAIGATSTIGCGGPAAPTDAAAADGGTDAATDAPTLDGATDTGADAAMAGDLSADYCAPLATQLCAAASTCECGVLLPGGALDTAACVARWTSRCLDAWQPFVDAGAVVDAAAATECVTTIANATPTCGTPSPLAAFASCAPFVVEPVAIGAACRTPYCAGGEGFCAEGTCTMRGAEGDACNGMFDCQTGLACNGATCAALGAGGAACTSDLACTPPLQCLGSPGSCALLHGTSLPCASTSECAIGLVCDATGRCVAQPATCASDTDCGNRARCGSVRACGARAGSGEACVDDRECAVALYCDAGACAARPGLGESCARGTVCAPGLGCDTDGGHCVTLPTSGPCAFGEMGGVCAEGFACHDDFTCGALPTEGQPCAGGNVCAPGLGCDFGPTGSTCIVPRGEGGACESDRSCQAALHCGPAGSCVADLPNGSPCPNGNECAGACVPDASGGLSCAAAPAEGDPCVSADQCPAALTCAVQTRACVPEVCLAL